jgi:hypothetical protein
MAKVARAPTVAAMDPAVHEPLLTELKFSTLLWGPLALAWGPLAGAWGPLTVASSLHPSLVMPAPLLLFLPLLPLLLLRVRLWAPLLLPLIEVRHEGATDGAYVGGDLLCGAIRPDLVVGIADISSVPALPAALPPLLLPPLARTRDNEDMMVRATMQLKNKVFIVISAACRCMGKRKTENFKCDHFCDSEVHA